MGQANQRGSLEERKQQAMQVLEEEKRMPSVRPRSKTRSMSVLTAIAAMMVLKVLPNILNQKGNLMSISDIQHWEAVIEFLKEECCKTPVHHVGVRVNIEIQMMAAKLNLKHLRHKKTTQKSGL
jgi:hypothetical protein